MPRIAGLSVDLDDRWTYLKTLGDPAWETAAGFLPMVVPRILEFLAARGLQATFFVVGRDAERPHVQELLHALVDAGHEIGNHSYSHEPWMHRFDGKRLSDEIALAEEAIAIATGCRPIGFRGPGHSVNDAVRSVLAARGYLYDASPLPTFVMPLVRRLYFRGVALTPEQRRERAQLGGALAAGLGSNRPNLMRIGKATLVELPVTTFPGIRVPIHFTYLQQLDRVSRRLARGYFAAGLMACQAARVEPCLLLHATDFLGCDDALSMGFFPGMSLPSSRKLGLVDECLRAVSERYHMVPLREFARAVITPIRNIDVQSEEALP